MQRFLTPNVTHHGRFGEQVRESQSIGIHHLANNLLFGVTGSNSSPALIHGSKSNDFDLDDENGVDPHSRFERNSSVVRNWSR